MLIHRDQTPLTQEEQARVAALLTRDEIHHREFIQYCVSRQIQGENPAQGLNTIFTALCAQSEE